MSFLHCKLKIDNALFFSSVEDISSNIWEELSCEQDVYFNRSYLKAIEINHPEITFSYIVLIDENKVPIAFASLQIINFYIDSIKNDLELLVRKIKTIGRKLHILPQKKALQVIICGNTFVSGEHGVYIQQNQDKKKVVKELAKAILYLVNSDKKLKKTIDAFLLKDFVKESLFITDTLKDYKYHPFLVEPNMVFHLNKNWQSFDDYIAAMKTKFRVKAKKALQKSANLQVETLTTENIDKHLLEMTTLYKKVATKADFNLGDFNLETYKDLLRSFKENYILRTYRLEGKMVGFLSGIINNHNLDAHFVGIDYQLNRTHAIYQRMLYDYIDIAISKNLSTINFGRTASEIKSSVGAEPQDLTMYLRHKKRITNKIIKLFLQHIQPTPFQQKFPFKKI